VFAGKKSTIYKVARGRGSDVLEEHLGEAEGILHCDRYSAYKKYAKEKAIDLAFCWAHVRRDFVRLSKLAEYKEWAEGVVLEIGEIYRRAGERCLPEGEKAFQERVYGFIRKREEEQAEANGEKLKVLESVERHCHGLTTVCVDPEVSLDNNKAERALRGPVVGRKNYWGSKAKWSGELAAELFSLIETAEQNGKDPKGWLRSYLEACAANKGRAPPPAPWLPIQTQSS